MLTRDRRWWTPQNGEALDGGDQSGGRPAPEDAVAMTASDDEVAHSGRLRGDLVRGSLWTLLSALVSIPVNAAVNVVVVRSLGVHELGRYATYVTSIAIVTTFVNLGVSEATVQWLAAATARADLREQTRLIRRCSGYHAVLEGPVLAAVVFALLARQSLQYAVLGAIGVWLTHALGTASVVLTATARNALSARVGLAVGTATQVGIALSAAVTHRGVALYALQALMSAATPALGFAVVGSAARRAIIRPTLRPWVGTAFAKYAGAAAASSLLGLVVFGRSEILVLQAAGQTAAVALFVVAASAAGQITIPMDSLMGPLAPTAAGLLAVEPGRASELLLRSLRVTAMFGAFTLVVAVPVGAWLLPTVFGGRYASARGAFVALAVVSCFQSLVVPVLAFAFAMRRATLAAGINAIGLVVDVGLALSLIPAIGLPGAVIANVASQLVALVLLGGAIARRLHLSASNIMNTIAPFAIASVLVGSAALVLSRPAVGAVSLSVAVAAPSIVLFMTLSLAPRLQIPQAEFVGVVARAPRVCRTPLAVAAHVLPLCHLRGWSIVASGAAQ